MRLGTDAAWACVVTNPDHRTIYPQDTVYVIGRVIENGFLRIRARFEGLSQVFWDMAGNSSLGDHRGVKAPSQVFWDMAGNSSLGDHRGVKAPSQVFWDMAGVDCLYKIHKRLTHGDGVLWPGG